MRPTLVAQVLLTLLVAGIVVPAPATSDHAVVNRVYVEPAGEPGHVVVHYLELAKAAQGGRVRIFMGDGYVACLNGPVGYAMAPATQHGYIAIEWRGCNPIDPVATFTYRLESHAEFGDDEVQAGLADAHFAYTYPGPGVYFVDWRAGTGAGGNGPVVVP